MIAIAIATLLSGTAATHQVSVDHRGQRYDVAHRAQVETRVKTVGAATGSKPGIQRCRWSSTVRVERTIAGNGAAAAALLPGARTVEGDTHGACMGRQAAVRDARVDAAAAEMVAAARADHATTLAAIDAAHGRAVN